MQINPYKNYSILQNISYGDPNLKTGICIGLWIIIISKTWENHSLSTSVYYRQTDSIMQPVSFMRNRILESTTAKS